VLGINAEDITSHGMYLIAGWFGVKAVHIPGACALRFPLVVRA
jgi:hypothetical protein